MEVVQIEVRDLTMGLEVAADQANLLTTLALSIVGGSIITLLQTSYLRPGNWRYRSAYLLFVPAWYFLGKSIYYGSEVRAVHLAYLLLPPTSKVDFLGQANLDVANQSDCLLLGLLMLAIWLALYLAWWICTDRPAGGKLKARPRR